MRGRRHRFQRSGLSEFSRRTVGTPHGVQAVDEKMRFSVWTGLAAHRPLGNINRPANAPIGIRPSSVSGSTAARSMSRVAAR